MLALTEVIAQSHPGHPNGRCHCDRKVVLNMICLLCCSCPARITLQNSVIISCLRAILLGQPRLCARAPRFWLPAEDTIQQQPGTQYDSLSFRDMNTQF